MRGITMGNERPNIFPALQLTDRCNKNCAACLRSPESTKHHLSYAEIEAYIEDLGRLSAAYRIAFQFTTGGEPTIWKDGDKTIVDVL
ncbi:MAG: hypothetical protein HN348_25410, partial [Proteobacteria bacterium]|nr:hypothetical protein [Pseudomonadota bacterium]